MHAHMNKILRERERENDESNKQHRTNKRLNSRNINSCLPFMQWILFDSSKWNTLHDTWTHGHTNTLTSLNAILKTKKKNVFRKRKKNRRPEKWMKKKFLWLLFFLCDCCPFLGCLLHLFSFYFLCAALIISHWILFRIERIIL